MNDLHPATAAAAGVAGLLAGLVVPRLIAAIPEPEPEEPDPLEDDRPAVAEGDAEEPKELYADIAARPGLAWKAALASGMGAALIGLVLGRDLSLLVVLPLVPVCVALSVIDWRTRLLPTRVIAPSYALTVVTILLAWLLGDRDAHDLGRAALGWLIYGGMFFLLWFVYPRGLGYGDVRLSGLLGLALGWVGWSELLVGIFSGLLFGGVLGAALSIVTRRRDNPFGPFMVLGALAGIVLGQPVQDWYLG